MAYFRLFRILRWYCPSLLSMAGLLHVDEEGFAHQADWELKMNACSYNQKTLIVLFGQCTVSLCVFVYLNPLRVMSAAPLNVRGMCCRGDSSAKLAHLVRHRVSCTLVYLVPYLT